MKKTQQLLAAVAVLVSVSALSARGKTIEYSNAAKNVATVSSAQMEAGENTTWKDVMSGRIAPLTLKAGSLDSSWNLFKSAGGDFAALVEVNENRMGGAPKPFFTQGQTMTIGEETYLVAYRQQPVGVSISNFPAPQSYDMSPDEWRKKFAFTRDSVLLLSLLSTRTMGNITDIKPFSTSVFPSVVTASTPEGRAELRRQSSGHLKQLVIAIMQNSQENNEIYPPMQNMYLLKKALLPYTKTEKVFRHPGSNAFYVPNASLSRKKLASFESPSTTASVYEAQPDADGFRNVGFVDGHVKAVRIDQWAKIKKDSGIK